eukprot:1632852-Pleurochrysis_carterae.AAC.1
MGAKVERLNRKKRDKGEAKDVRRGSTELRSAACSTTAPRFIPQLNWRPPASPSRNTFPHAVPPPPPRT